MNKKKLISTVVKVAVPVVILIVILIVVFAKGRKEEFSLAQYVLVNVTGIDGHGKATLSINEVGLYDTLAGKDATEEEKNKYRKFVESISFTCDRTEELSNGDNITIKTEYSETAAKNAGVKVDITERQHKIWGLHSGDELDVFKDIKIITAGISPFITVTYINESENEYLRTIEYDINQTSGLAIGDKIVITAVIDEATATSKGYYIPVKEMEYTITKADKYIDSVDEIDKELLEKTVAECIDTVFEETADTTFHMTYKVTNDKNYLFRDGNEEAVDLELYKVEVVNNTSNYEREHQNYVLVFIKGQIKTPTYVADNPYNYLTAYFCFVYSDAILTSDGEFLLATNEPAQRYIADTSYEDLVVDLEASFGTDYSFSTEVSE